MYYRIINGSERPGAYALGVLIDTEYSKKEAVRSARKFCRDMEAGDVPVVIAQVDGETTDEDFMPGVMVQDDDRTRRLWSNRPDWFEVERHDHEIEFVRI